MKYMTFNSSCSYAGLANLLSCHGIDTEDCTIALQMHLPYLFSKEDGQYRSGPMLQGARWFNLYLRPLGLIFTECQLSREEAAACLRSHPPAMLGLHVTPPGKHAVIFTAFREDRYYFLNNKHKLSDEPDTLCLTGPELLSRLDEPVTVGSLQKADPVSIDFLPHLEGSLLTLRSLHAEIQSFCTQEQTPAAQQKALNTIFRPILLDGVSMLELLEAERTAAPLRLVRSQLMAALKENVPHILSTRLDMSLLSSALEDYAELISTKIKFYRYQL